MPLPRDLVLVVGPEKKRIEASAMAMRNASTVFDKMLGPTFSGGRRTEIELPEDDEKATKLLVNLSEHRPPDELPPSLGKQLAILMDKYDAPPVRQYLRSYLKLLCCLSKNAGLRSRLKWLETALILDEPDVFEMVFNWVLMNHVDVYVEALDSSYSCLDLDPRLAGLLDMQLCRVKKWLCTDMSVRLRMLYRRFEIRAEVAIEIIPRFNTWVMRQESLSQLTSESNSLVYLDDEYDIYEPTRYENPKVSLDSKVRHTVRIQWMHISNLIKEDVTSLCIDCVKTFLDGQPRKCRKLLKREWPLANCFSAVPFHLGGEPH